MFLFDIFIYLLFAYIMFLFSSSSFYKNEENKGVLDKYLWGFVAFFTIISAIRWGVGVDSISYATCFMSGATDHEIAGQINEKELLNKFFIHLIHDLGLHFSIGLGLYAFFQIFFLTKALEKYKYILLYMPFILFGSVYYQNLMNGVRQMIVACGFVWASRFIVERKPLHYFLFICIGYFMHTSTLILLPLYFIPFSFALQQKRNLLLCIYTLCFILGNSPQFGNIVSYVEGLTKLIGYENYADNAVKFLSGDYAEEVRSLGPMQLSYLLTGYFIIWFGPKLDITYAKQIPYFNLWFLFAYLYGCFYFLFCNVSHIFIRPVLYLCLFQMILCSLLLYDFCCNLKNKFYYYSRALFVCVIWTSTVWSIYKSLNYTPVGKREYVTYKVFFMNDSEVKKIKSNFVYYE